MWFLFCFFQSHYFPILFSVHFIGVSWYFIFLATTALTIIHTVLCHIKTGQILKLQPLIDHSMQYKVQHQFMKTVVSINKCQLSIPEEKVLSKCTNFASSVFRCDCTNSRDNFGNILVKQIVVKSETNTGESQSSLSITREEIVTIKTLQYYISIIIFAADISSTSVMMDKLE